MTLTDAKRERIPRCPRSNITRTRFDSYWSFLPWPPCRRRPWPSPTATSTSYPETTTDRYRLAVRIDAEWQFFKTNHDAPPHVIETGEREQRLCMAWEAPRYQRISRQIVYASTQYLNDQPLWLVRNGGVAGVPLLGELFERLFGNWGRKPDASGANPDQVFKDFHRSRPDDTDEAPWNRLAEWHNTSAWLANHESYELVRSAIDLAGLPYGTERLLMLKGGRPLASWIPFTTRAHKQNRLRVAVSYSGDLDDGEPHVYQYVFDIR